MKNWRIGDIAVSVGGFGLRARLNPNHSLPINALKNYSNEQYAIIIEPMSVAYATKVYKIIQTIVDKP